MKKLLLCFVSMLFVLPVCADVIPYRVSDIPAGVIGLYQTNNNLVTYSQPDKNSKVNYRKNWAYVSVSASNFAEQMFAVLIDKKELSFLYANDIDEDFVQVIYDKKSNKTGWAYKEDSFQFLPWITFFNMYGKKYGLRILKDAPAEIMQLHSKSERNSQVIDKLVRPKTIRLTTIQGNWALVTVLEYTGAAKTGYMRWRSDNGELYLFPAIR